MNVEKLLTELKASGAEELTDRLFAFYEDVRSSYELAMTDASVDHLVRQRIHNEVDDYVSNKYGE